jgi:hypothetical protein
MNMQGGLEGFYQLTVSDAATGKITKQTEPFKNLITDVGLDHFFSGYDGGSVGSLVGGYVGTGNTAPAFSDTHLTTYLAGTNNLVGSASPMSAWTYVAAAGGVPPYWTTTGTWTFPVGTATGTLAEVGIGGYTTASPNYVLQSHALIVDGTGTPTTITVLSTEQLTLTYTLNLYWNTTTQTGSINISGVTYAISWLPASLQFPNGSPQYIFSQFFASGVSLQGYNGALGTILSYPSGATGNNNNTGSVSAYTLGSYYQQVTYTCDINHLNFTGGISALVVRSAYHQFQIGFTPPIPKDNTYTFTFVCNFSLARYP